MGRGDSRNPSLGGLPAPRNDGFRSALPILLDNGYLRPAISRNGRVTARGIFSAYVARPTRPNISGPQGFRSRYAASGNRRVRRRFSPQGRPKDVARRPRARHPALRSTPRPGAPILGPKGRHSGGLLFGYFLLAKRESNSAAGRDPNSKPAAAPAASDKTQAPTIFTRNRRKRLARSARISGFFGLPSVAWIPALHAGMTGKEGWRSRRQSADNLKSTPASETKSPSPRRSPRRSSKTPDNSTPIRSRESSCSCRTRQPERSAG